MEREVDVIVVGAGAAGIFAAWRAASLGKRVVLLEKTNRLGTKILISGGGKCNITHDGPIHEVLRRFRPHEAAFLKPACYRFDNRKVVSMLTSRGLEVYTRPDGRIFPVHQNAKDVVAILRSYLEEAGVEIRFETPVRGLVLDSEPVAPSPLPPSPEGSGVKETTTGAQRVVGVALDSERDAPSPLPPSPVGSGVKDGDPRVNILRAKAVIVAAGGSSYPNSGTTGDAWPWLREHGHSVVKIRAALAPMYLKLEEHDAERSGLALRDVVMKARAGGKEIARWTGDLLFTHQGISGPCALGVSREVAERMETGEVEAWVDLVGYSHERLGELIDDWKAENPRKRIRTLVEEFVPERLAEALIGQVGLDGEHPASQIGAKARNRLVEAIKNFRLGAVRIVPLEKGEVVAGGVSLDEVDSQTMASRKVEGLYLCGELLDIAGPVGGYNLQAAFATGFVAGESAAKAS